MMAHTVLVVSGDDEVTAALIRREIEAAGYGGLVVIATGTDSFTPRPLTPAPWSPELILPMLNVPRSPVWGWQPPPGYRFRHGG